MKKQLLGLLIGLGLALVPTSYAKADTQIDEQYKEAYDLTMKVVDIADKYKAAPASKYGRWRYNEILDAVKQAKLDEEMSKARNKINNLPSDIQIHKNCLSQILDSYEDQLYYQVVFGIRRSDDVYISTIKQDNPLTKYKTIEMAQIDVVNGRRLIENIKDEYRASYRTAIDRVQGGIFIALNNFLTFPKESNDPAAKYHLIKSIECVQNGTKNDKVVQDYLETLMKDAKLLKVGHVVSDDEILKFALNNGFKEEVVDETVKYKGEKAYKLLVDKQGNSIEFYENNKTLLCKHKKLGKDSQQAILEFLTPKVRESLIRYPYDTTGDYGFVDNGFYINLTQNDKEVVYEFYRCCYNE